MSKFTDRLLSIPFPDTCIVCGNPTENKLYACPACKDKINYMNSFLKCRTCLGLLHTAQNGMCGYCISENTQYSRLISCVRYTGEVANTLRAYKFRNRPDYHIGFSKLACEVLERDGVYFDAVVCVPVSKKTFKNRGYDQSALIAKRIANHFNVEYIDNSLVKIKETEKQSSLKYKDRKNNIKGAFGVYNPEQLRKRTILLVDDIFTTGYTMREAAKMCAPFVENIVAFTIARGTLEE